MPPPTRTSIIGAVLIPGARAPKLITRDMLAGLKPGAVLVDVAIDQGGCFETSRPTTHSDPTYVVDGIVHYCVANMPGAVPVTSTFALTNVTLPYVEAIAELGVREAIARDRALARGVNVVDGKLTYEAVADAHGLDFTPLEQVVPARARLDAPATEPSGCGLRRAVRPCHVNDTQEDHDDQAHTLGDRSRRDARAGRPARSRRGQRRRQLEEAIAASSSPPTPAGTCSRSIPVRRGTSARRRSRACRRASCSAASTSGPATGDLYALGSDKVVYRVNVKTAIAVAEGPAFEMAPAALNSGNIGFDFNPTVDKIRVTSDADDNIRLNPDEGNLLSKDTSLTPADVMVVGSAYTNSSFTAFATRPTVTELYALDIAPSKDRLWIQRPANNGTLIMPVSLDFNLGPNAGFDIVGSDATGNIGYVAGTQAGRSSSELWRVNLATGQTRSLGRIGKGVTITGLAAWQDQ